MFLSPRFTVYVWTEKIDTRNVLALSLKQSRVLPIMLDNNFPHIPSSWIYQYLRNDPTFHQVVKASARQHLEFQAATDTPLVIPVIELAVCQDNPNVYYVAKSDLVSVYSLLDEIDLTSVDLTVFLANKLNVRVSDLTKVVPYVAQDGGQNSCDLPSYFVPKDRLFFDRGYWRQNLANALNIRNSLMAKFFLEQTCASSNYWRSVADDDNDLLILAIKMDDLAIYQRLLQRINRTDLDFISKNFNEIARHGGTNILSYLIEKYPAETKAIINSDDPRFGMPIWHAIAHEKEDIAIILLEHTHESIILSVKQKNGMIYWALENEMFKFLDALSLKPFITKLLEYNGLRNLGPLHRAICNLPYETFKKLYDIYIKLNLPLPLSKTNGDTILHTLIRERRVKTRMQNCPELNNYVQIFSDSIGLDNPLLTTANNDGQTPLHLLASIGTIKTINMFYDAHLQQNVPFEEDIGGDTFFTRLIVNRWENIIEHLLKRPDFNSDLICKPNTNGLTSMVQAVQFGSQKICTLLYDFCESNNCLITLFKKSTSSLVHAIMNLQLPIIKLLTKNETVNNLLMVPDEDGYPPLIYAIQSGSFEIITQIYDKTSVDQACLQSPHVRFTPLHIAVLCQDLNAVEYMLKDPIKGQALAWILDADGKTALDYAWTRSSKMARLILEAGTQIHRQLISPFIYAHSQTILLIPGTPRSELLRYKHSHEPTIDGLSERTTIICDITPQSIQSRINDLERL